MTTLHIGQFSRSPVLAAARALNWDTDMDLHLEVGPVPSSPAQFESLRSGAIDVALTSPDNVLLYSGTAKNPLGEQLPVRIHRAIDGGLGLALMSRPDLTTPEALGAAPVAVDVLPSGFAILLKELLRQLGLRIEDLDFVEEGATPRRAERLIDGAIGCTILNAESRVRATHQGMRVWATSMDVSPIYPGTVLATLADGPDVMPLLDLWDRTTEWLLDTDISEVSTVLESQIPGLGDRDYLALLRDPDVGLARNRAVTADQLRVLADLRRSSGAWAPDEEHIRALATA
ncbi:MAG: hypothetical protein VW082_01800 [Candidatus Nanopelagicales bacterium]